MKNLIILLVLLLTGCASQIDQEHKNNSLSLVQSWIKALDNKNADEAWKLTSTITKERFEKERKIKYWFGIREPMGEAIKREFQMNWKLEVYQGNIPDGTHRDIRYWSKYKNRDLAKERFIVTLENGEWKLVDWYVK